MLAEQRQLAATRCEACGEPGVLAEHSRALGVAVCRECCRNDPQRYELVSKATARADYYLSDADLKALPALRKGNPRNVKWADLRLYMRGHLADAQDKRHGSAAAARAKRDKAERAKQERSAKRHRQEASRGAREAAAAAVVDKAEASAAHEHVWGEAESANDPDNEDLRRKKCTLCGCEVTFEEL